jgi:large subunit ribosomal protein L28
MARQCEICGKGPSTGNTISRRGKAKYLGGVGRKVTGISKRQFKPNLQKMKVVINGTVQRIKVCTQCLRSGKVQRPIKRKPFQIPTT